MFEYVNLEEAWAMMNGTKFLTQTISVDWPSTMGRSKREDTNVDEL